MKKIEELEKQIEVLKLEKQVAELQLEIAKLKADDKYVVPQTRVFPTRDYTTTIPWHNRETTVTCGGIPFRA